ncbi:MAG: SpoIIE family protein phosphatase [Calditrichaeota bacterium]|nr:SpoIIE family protein phosphatase [Calditrichota bacterium]
MPGFFDYLSEKYHTENAQEINQRLIELSSLFEISQILNSSLDLENILNNILLIPMGRLMVSRGIILLRQDNHFVPHLWKGISGEVEQVKLQESDLPQNETVIQIDDYAKQNNKNITRFAQKFNLALFIPIFSQQRIIGVALYGQKLNKSPFTQEEKDFLNSLANLSATSIENALKVDEIKNINQLLDQRIHQLKTLFDIAQGLSATLESEKIIKLLTYALMGQMLVYHYAILLSGERGLRKIDSKGFLPEEIENLIENEPELKNYSSAFIVDSLQDSSLKKRLQKLSARVFIPMRHQNKFLGFILLGEKIDKKNYADTDLEFLSTLVSQAVISLENARLFRETLEKQRIEQELLVAKTIQSKLLPRELPRCEGYDLWGLNHSSKEVGGDYFDIIAISENRYALAIGDVSGKSVPAALIMANLQAGLRIIISEDLHLDMMVSKLNRLIYQNTDLDKYVTFFVGILDNLKHELTYVNAGHNPPILQKHSGHTIYLEDGGIILGMMPEFSYKTGHIRFEKDDILFCYTDGVNEALNKYEEEYGEERLKEIIRKNRTLSAQKIADTLVESVKTFTGNAPQYDDITLLVVKRL